MEGREVSNTEVEIIPLTDDQIAAIRELRFVWTNLNHSVSWGLTTDESVARRCPGGVTSMPKSRNPTVVEYDCMMGHPHAVELVAEIQREAFSLGTLGASA
jgi:hypothetical protein